MSDNMTRVSLTEDYDDRSVISKLNKMSDIVDANTAKCDSAVTSADASAQSAQRVADTFAGSVGAIVAEAKADIASSKTAVDQAKAEVDATVTTVAQAVQTANNASSVATQAAGQVTDKVAKTGTDTPQVISGTGGLQIAGDLDVGTDLSVAGQANIAGLAVESLGNAVKLSNDHGVNVNGHNLNNAVTTDEVQTITGFKKFGGQFNTPFYGELHGNGSAVSVKNLDYTKDDGITRYYSGVYIKDTNENVRAGFYPLQSTDGSTTFMIRTKSANDEAQDIRINNRFDMSNNVVTKGFVASTDGTTNNLMHREGNETIIGNKKFDDTLEAHGLVSEHHNLVRVAGTGYRKIYTGTKEFNHHNVVLMVMPRRIGFGMGILAIGGHSTITPHNKWLCGDINSLHINDFVVTYEEDSQLATIWQKATGTTDGYCTQIMAYSWNGNCFTNPWYSSTDTTVYDISSTGYTDTEGNEHTFKYYVVSE